MLCLGRILCTNNNKSTSWQSHLQQVPSVVLITSAAVSLFVCFFSIFSIFSRSKLSGANLVGNNQEGQYAYDGQHD